MIGFEPSEDQKLMHDAVAGFAAQLRDRLREVEKARELPADARKTAVEMGLGGAVSVPESHGGAGLGLVTAVLLEDTLAAGDPAAPFALPGPGALATAVAELGTPEQAQAILGKLAGSDRFGAVAWGEKSPNRERPGFSTTAEKDGDGWILRGEKVNVLHGDKADVLVVFAQVDASRGWDGLGAFVVEKDAKGFSAGPRTTTLGLDAASFASVKLVGVRVPASARLMGGDDFGAALLRFFVKEGLKVAARCVGLCQAAVDVTTAYVIERKAFGKPIGHFQAVAFTVADRAMDVDASRALVWRAASLWDCVAAGTAKEKDALLHSAYAISYAQEAAMRCGDDAVQLHGGAGFIRDYPVEKMMRDAKHMQVCVLTAEHADQIAAAVEVGARIDLGLVLPTPEGVGTFV
jgi:alkylation response protein AidB-like acyl-CoA dehydrogenase